MKIFCFALPALAMTEGWSRPTGNPLSVGQRPHSIVMDLTKYQANDNGTDLKSSATDLEVSSTDLEVSSTDLETSEPLPLSQPLLKPLPKPLLQLQPQTKSTINTIRQQSIILRTTLVVAAVAAVTNHLPYKQTRGDMLAGTIIFMVGDWGAQLLTHSKSVEDKTTCSNSFKMDSNRFVISAFLGCFWAGICNPSVYTAAEHLFPGKSVKLVLMKMTFSLSILSTAGNYATILFRRFFKQVWEAKTTQVGLIFRACIQSCNRDMMDVLKVDLKIWPLYDILCFTLIPPSLRPITGALMASFWAMYMSIASAQVH